MMGAARVAPLSALALPSVRSHALRGRGAGRAVLRGGRTRSKARVPGALRISAGFQDQTDAAEELQRRKESRQKGAGLHPSEDKNAAAAPEPPTSVDGGPTYPAVAGATSALELRQDGPRGRGLFSTRAGAPREVMMSIPLHYALLVRGDLNADKEVEEADSRVLQKQAEWETVNAAMPKTVKMIVNAGMLEEKWRLAVFLLWATRAGGPVWTQHNTVLPRGAECPLLMTWGDADLAELQDAALESSIRSATAQGAKSFANFIEAWEDGAELLAALGNPSPEDFVWALAMVRSRGMGDTIGSEHVAMIVPWADMGQAREVGAQANHTFEPYMSGANNAAGTHFEFDVFDESGLPANVEATVSYGDTQDNETLMEKYGFFVPENPNDRIEFTEEEKAQAQTLSINRKHFESVVGSFAEKTGQSGRLGPLLASLPLDDADAPPDMAKEKANSLRLALLINKKLEGYKTTAAEDHELLDTEQEKEDPRARLCAALGYRLERKRVMINASEFLVMYSSVCEVQLDVELQTPPRPQTPPPLQMPPLQ